MSKQREVEIKFRVGDLEPVRRRLAALGATHVGAEHEENLIFDEAGGRLRAADELLRLRRDRHATLTFKSPLPDQRYKVRREIEVEVGDFDAARDLLEALGYRVVASYEKDRETWRHAGTAVLLDRLSIGSFVELEGEPDAIDRVAQALGFDVARGITKSYLALLAESQA